jgi:DNA-binding MarR family transcriptional regulator
MEAERAELITRARHKRAYGRRYVVLTTDEFDALAAEVRLQHLREKVAAQQLARQILGHWGAYAQGDTRMAWTSAKSLSNSSQTLAIS